MGFFSAFGIQAANAATSYTSLTYNGQVSLTFNDNERAFGTLAGSVTLTFTITLSLAHSFDTYLQGSATGQGTYSGSYTGSCAGLTGWTSTATFSTQISGRTTGLTSTDKTDLSYVSMPTFSETDSPQPSFYCLYVSGEIATILQDCFAGSTQYTNQACHEFSTQGGSQTITGSSSTYNLGGGLGSYSISGTAQLTLTSSTTTTSTTSTTTTSTTSSTSSTSTSTSTTSTLTSGSTGTCPSVLSAQTFGLPAGNGITSPPSDLRVYHAQTGTYSVYTPGYQLGPGDKKVPHKSIDISSKDSSGSVVKTVFTAGVSGTVRIIPGNKYNAFEIILSNGNRLRFIHASQILVKNNATVNPTTPIGVTGGTGPNYYYNPDGTKQWFKDDKAFAIHLHVQGQDKKGRTLDDPNCALVGLKSSVADPASDLAGQLLSSYAHNSTAVSGASSQGASQAVAAPLSSGTTASTYSLTLGSQSFQISYSGGGATITSVQPDNVNGTSLVFGITPGAAVNLNITLPRNLVDSTSGGSDVGFWAYADGYDPIYITSTTSTLANRTLEIPLDGGINQFSLIGTFIAGDTSFTNAQGASVVLGAPNFLAQPDYSGTSAYSMGPISATYDSAGNLWVSDLNNNRVLRFSPPFSNGMSANLVIGQPDFTSSNAATTQNGLNGNEAIAFDSSGNLWVADFSNNRVLRFSPPFTNGMNANLVIGQTLFTVGPGYRGTTANTFYLPYGLAFDSSGNLWVTDTGENRVLRFSPPFTTGISANLVIGQSGFTTYASSTTQSGLHYPRAIAFDPSGNLWVADELNNRTLRFSVPFSNGMNANLVLGQSGFTSGLSAVTAAGMKRPWGVTADAAGNIWVADTYNHRVLEFTTTLTNGKSASLVLGQSDFTSSSFATAQNRLYYPTAVAFDSSGNAGIVDFSNSRVVRFPTPFSNGMSANLILGKSSYTVATQNGMSFPHNMFFDTSGNLWISDDGNGRVLQFSGTFSNGMNANLVLGQPDLTTVGYTPTQSGLTSADAVVMDSSGKLWVADYNGNRILRFSPPFANGMQADLLLGQTTFTANAAATTRSGLNTPHGLAFDSDGNLWVADTNNNRILKFSPPFSTGMSANLVLGQSGFTTGSNSVAQNSLYHPRGITFDSNGNLWVADYLNNRVLTFSPPFSTGRSASLVLGQTIFTSGTSSASQSGLYDPAGVALDPKGNLWVADTGNNRVLEFSFPFTNGMSASHVVGQSDFTSHGYSTTQNTLNFPRSVRFDANGNLWVADEDNNRVLELTCSSICTPSISISFSVQGGGTGYSAPVLTYTTGGTQRTTVLTSTAASVPADYGSSWSISSTLTGSSSNERWATNQDTSGTVTGWESVTGYYYHQYNATFGYTVTGGGSGYTAPTVIYTQLGFANVADAASSVWTDAGSAYSYPAQLTGSSSTERWATGSTSGTVASAGAVSVSYYHQYLFTASFSITGGGTATAPTLTSTQFGSSYSSALQSGISSTIWLDKSASYSATNPLGGSTSTERWFTLSGGGTVSASFSFAPVFVHQFYLTTQASPTVAGSVTPPSGFLAAGSSVPISAIAGIGYQFNGWTGTGSGSYTGSNAAATVTLNEPIVETANFVSTAYSVTVGGQNFQVNIVSNSTISAFAFSQTAKAILFTATGTTGTQGYFNVTWAKTLLNGTLALTIDGASRAYSLKQTSLTYSLYATYTHSAHAVSITGTTAVPEFPLQLIASTFAVVLILLVGVMNRLARGRARPLQERQT